MKPLLTFVSPFLFAVVVACGSEEPTNGSSTAGTTPGANSSGSSSSSGAAAPTGGDGGTATGATACEKAGSEICARACACSNDGKCHVGVEIDAGMPASVNFDTEAKCRDLYVTLGCLGGGEPGFDYGTCEARVKASSCVESAGGGAILLAAECKTSK
jgi:hypothetical protein